MQIGQILDQYIKERIQALADDNCEIPETILVTDSFSDVIEKLIISHIRAWNIESEARKNLTIEQLGQNRKKERINNGIIRPRLIEALNKMFDLAIRGKFSLEQDSVKMYEQGELNDKTR